MKDFLKKIFLFSLPVILLTLPPVVLLKISGENTDIEGVIEKKEKYLIGYAYDESNYKYLKWKEIESRPKLDILALGSSRILQFRDTMFKSEFYNAGYTVSSISDFVPFLQSIPEKKYPDILIINLDQWMFNANWDPVNEEHESFKPSLNTDVSGRIIVRVWRDLLNDKYDLGSLFGKDEVERIGVNAYFNGTGFRNDGSMFYASQIVKLMNNDTTSEDYNYSDTYSRIRNGNGRFEYGDRVNQLALAELKRLLSFCKDRGIYVVALLPPFADHVNDQIESNGHYGYMDRIYPELDPIFRQYNYELWDLSRLNEFGSGDNETIDGFHGGEVSYLRMLIYMAEHNSKVKDYIDLPALKADLGHRKNDYIVYEY